VLFLKVKQGERGGWRQENRSHSFHSITSIIRIILKMFKHSLKETRPKFLGSLISPPFIGVWSFRVFQNYIFFFLACSGVIFPQHTTNGALANV
jgi:hypothetical protein